MEVSSSVIVNTLIIVTEFFRNDQTANYKIKINKQDLQGWLLYKKKQVCYCFVTAELALNKYEC